MSPVVSRLVVVVWVQLVVLVQERYLYVCMCIIRLRMWLETINCVLSDTLLSIFSVCRTTSVAVRIRPCLLAEATNPRCNHV